ncbi:MAG: hypothetical protein J6W33_01575 [Spirochaetia bacterium]|nr:hypothetical protein [Spirochaetia bacterium]
MRLVKVKHGHWVSDITDGYENICSVCHHEFVDKWDNDSNYCPNCGARMDAQIGEDKSHPFAESVMMGKDEEDQ